MRCRTRRSIEALTQVKGIGRWTAEMFLMFRLHRPDVLPVGDLGIVKAVQKAYRPSQSPDARAAHPHRRGVASVSIDCVLVSVGEPRQQAADQRMNVMTYERRRASVRLLLALVARSRAGLPSPLAQNQSATTDVPRLEFEKYTLPNGLEVILSQKRGLPMVAVNLWYHVGSGQRGGRAAPGSRICSST